MAEKRMFAKSIVLSDAFLDMPMSARCLYFTLGMLADDDGFVGAPKSIMRQCGASQDDFAILIGKRFVLAFESGVIVIKHWRINNYLRQDRYTETTYIEERQSLALDAKGAYVEGDSGILPGTPPGIPSIDKISIESEEIKNSTPLPPRGGTAPSVGKGKPQKKVAPIFETFAGDNADLLAALNDFADMRQKIKKPLATDRAKQMLVNKLAQLSQNPDIQIAILNQSIFHGWQGVFGLKDEGGGGQHGQTQGHPGSKWNIQTDTGE